MPVQNESFLEGLYRRNRLPDPARKPVSAPGKATSPNATETLAPSPLPATAPAAMNPTSLHPAESPAQETATPRARKPPSAPGNLRERDLAMFGRLGIPTEMLAENGVRRVTDAEARSECGITGTSGDVAGIFYPYYIPAVAYRVTGRLRRDYPEVDEDGKPKNKYLCPYGDRRHLYFVRGAKEKLADPECEIVLVEAEKSVLAVTAWAQRTRRNLLALGLGGCWGWRGRIGRDVAPDGERVEVRGPLPDMDACDGRSVCVMLDANAATNQTVQAARNALVRELRKRGCKVKVCELPQVEGVNGPDDLIAVLGDDALASVIDAARPAAEKKRKARANDADDPRPAQYADDALAQKFTQKHGDDHRFTAAWGHWSGWNGCVWRQDETLFTMDLSRQVCREASALCGDERLAARISSAQTVYAVERLARADRRHAAVVEQWDADPCGQVRCVPGAGKTT
jgi:hypothetical protein